MHYYSFNIGDYIKQTVHLTPMEDLCYRRLLDMYYETERPIPTETNWVSRRLRLDTELVESVLKEFFRHTENGWVNARCDEEISSYHVKADAARSNGKLGGRPKKTQSVILANPEETGSKANQEPITNNQEPVLKPKSRSNASRLPPDWFPSEEDIRFCNEKRPDLNYTIVADGFRDYWLAVPGAKGRKADWPATWRNWVRNQRQQFQPTGKQANRDSYAAQAAQAASKLNTGERNERTDERDITEYCTRVA